MAPTVPSTPEGSWIPLGKELTVAGYTITGGMLYVGKRLIAVAGHRIEPALIDPSLPVDPSNPDRSGTSMPYWPSYSEISTAARAAYLEWLAAGRRDESAYIGYVFLYLYGLERRTFADSPHSEQAKQDLPAIRSELEQLLRVYGSSNSFRRYAVQLLDIVSALTTGQSGSEPIMERIGYELPFSVRVGIGQIIAAGKALPPEWALSWVTTDPETTLRTPATRCAAEFKQLFRARYHQQFGDGLVIKLNRSKLSVTLTPASASFGGQVQIGLDLPDVAALKAPVSKLREIAETCCTELDAFSRWIGRNEGAPRTLAAVALLPKELSGSDGSDETKALLDWLETTLASDERAVCRTDDLLQQCSSFGNGKLAKSEAVLLAQLLEKRGYGVEPDVRFGGGPLGPGGMAVLFKLPVDFAAVASPQYAAATVLLHLAVAVAAADGSISSAEEQHLSARMQHALKLSDAERVRLSAHMTWLVDSKPSLTAVKKRLEPLGAQQRSCIADFIIGVAGADGQISPDEIRTLGKIYPMLGLLQDDVFRHVHAMAAGAPSVGGATDPVTVTPAQPASGYAIPMRPVATHTVRLDMAAVNTKLAQSAQISAILADIFTEETSEAAPQPVHAQTSGKLPPLHRTLLARLAQRPQWGHEQYEALAAECKLLPEAALDILNEAAYEHAGGPVLEGDDPVVVDLSTAKELLA